MINEKFEISTETFNKIINIVKKYPQYTFKIFGSRARKDNKPNSDIDIAIDGIISEKEKIEIKNEFDILDTPYQIDIVFIQDINKEEFKKSIERDGIKINE